MALDSDQKLPTSFISRFLWRLSLNWRLLIGVILPFALLPLVFIEDNDVYEIDGELRKSTVS